MAHGLGGVRQMRLDAFAARFQAAGYACLVFDYRHFGGSEGQPRQLLDVRKQQADWRSAVTFARGLPQVDGQRVVVWGTSFGGGHAIHTGATMQGVSAVIAQCPFTDGLASGLATNPITALRVTSLAIADQLRAWFGAPPLMLATSGAPRSTALMTAHDCLSGYLNLVPRGDVPFENRVAAPCTVLRLRNRHRRPGGRHRAPCAQSAARRSPPVSRRSFRHLRRRSLRTRGGRSARFPQAPYPLERMSHVEI
jgi:pimeloyl-ACP methyl ester carboxylesterase